DVDGMSTKNLEEKDVTSKIRGPEGTQVKLKIKSGESESTIEVTRAKIESQNITVSKSQDKLLIRINSYSQNLYEDFVKKTSSFKGNDEIKKIVIDLRDNGGGSLNSAVELLSVFVPKNTHVVSEKYNGEPDDKLYTKKEPFFPSEQIVILTNENTASASEITALSLRELRGAKIIGKETYGKGLVQQILPLSSGDHIKITIARWTSPSGIQIDKNNKIKPDKDIELTLPLTEKETLDAVDSI
ncbi:MAG: S41 family peptidase, partial [Patescibacteria group bacterium]